MPVVEFPDPREADENGIVAFGGDLHPDTLRLAYRQGIFPWPHTGFPLLWFCPLERAVLEFDRLHIPRSLAKARRQSPLRFTLDTAFEQVIEQCRRIKRPGQRGTWITPEIQRAYIRLHRSGDAHSVEAWDETGALVGGLYGVDSGGVFSGESMFHLAPNASKLALLFFVDYLSSRGADFIDIQQLTPHMAALGAWEIERDDFLARSDTARQRGLILFDKAG